MFAFPPPAWFLIVQSYVVPVPTQSVCVRLLTLEHLLSIPKRSQCLGLLRINQFEDQFTTIQSIKQINQSSIRRIDLLRPGCIWFIPIYLSYRRTNTETFYCDVCYRKSYSKSRSSIATYTHRHTLSRQVSLLNLIEKTQTLNKRTARYLFIHIYLYRALLLGPLFLQRIATVK